VIFKDSTIETQDQINQEKILENLDKIIFCVTCHKIGKFKINLSNKYLPFDVFFHKPIHTIKEIIHIIINSQ
jgi:hypothetical protein